MKKTKIICTIGPASGEKEILKEMIESGMDVARFNLAHASYDFCRKTITILRELEKETNKIIGILFDINGPELRLGPIENGSVMLQKNQIIHVYDDLRMGNEKSISINCSNVLDRLNENKKILLSDGKVVLTVKEKTSHTLVCQVDEGGMIYSNRTIHIPDFDIDKEYLSDKDKADIRFALEQQVDFIALSFVRNNFDVLDVNDYLIELGDEHIQLISKIGNMDAVDDIDQILNSSDGIMIARGDLGVEIPIEKLPGIQKTIIEKANLNNKVSIVATELLSTMEQEGRPTRAEVSDVYNAVIDGSDAVMLSGETTIGKFPVETTDMMEKIIVSAEEDINYIALLETAMRTEQQDVTTSIAYSVVDSANRLRVKAIVASTNSGYTAKKISRFRPMCPIIATSPNLETTRSMTLNFGVYPIHVQKFDSTDNIVDNCKKVAVDYLSLEDHDYIIITGGFPANLNNTNFMKIEEI